MCVCVCVRERERERDERERELKEGQRAFVRSLKIKEDCT